MSILVAMKFIESDLPDDVRDEILRKAASCPADECEGRAFHMIRVSDLSTCKRIVERRLLGLQRESYSEDSELVRFYREQLEILVEAGDAGAVYSGYVISRGRRFSYMVAPELGRAAHFEAEL